MKLSVLLPTKWLVRPVSVHDFGHAAGNANNAPLVLITGASTGGLGAESAFSLAKAHPKHLILAGRSPDRTRPVIDGIRERHPEVKVTFLPLDLTSQKSVRRAAEEIKHNMNGDLIDVLILNAAIMASPYGHTADGIELQFGTNYIGHFLFANLLLKENLVKSRIVVVSSSASVRNAENMWRHLDDLSYDNGKSYAPMAAYSLSKSASVLYARGLAERLKDRQISVYSLNPGSIKTNLQVYLTDEMRNATLEAARKDNPNFTVPVPKSLQQGCATQLRAALDPSLVSHSGAYLDDCQVTVYPEHVEAYPYTDKLWAKSEELVGERFDF